MILHVHPIDSLKGVIDAPASKSYSIRAILIAACGGQSQIIAPSNCDDAQVAMHVARTLGTKIQKKDGRYFFTSQKIDQVYQRLNVGESGTVLRFLLPLLSIKSRGAMVEGSGTLVGRPNHFLLQSLRQQGMKIKGYGPQESVPIQYEGGALRPGKIRIDGTLSSQFISALLITCPQLTEDTRLEITGQKIVSKDYITMTSQILKKSGITIKQISPRKFMIPGAQTFKGLKNYHVPSDYGLAAFFMAAASFFPSQLSLMGNWDKEFIQSDGKILVFLKKMGVQFTQTRTKLHFRGPSLLKGGTFDLKDCPDLVPIMAVLSLYAQGNVRLTNIAHARAKESDRISDLRKELLKVGARIQEKANELMIEPSAHCLKGGVLLDPHHDHRLAMAFAVLGLKIGLKIKDIECTRKSYPDFVSDLKSVAPTVKVSVS